MKHTARERRATLDRIVATPTALPAFDMEQFIARPRADQQMMWRAWTPEERMRCAHAAMRRQAGYSDDALIAIWYRAIDEKLG